MKYYTIYVYRKGYILNNHGDYSHSAMRAGRIKAEDFDVMYDAMIRQRVHGRMHSTGFYPSRHALLNPVAWEQQQALLNKGR